MKISGLCAMAKRIKSYFRNTIKRHRDLFELYTSGLNRSEIERLLQKDTREALSYYKDPELTPVFEKYLSHDDPAVVSWAEDGLEFIKDAIKKI